MESSSTGHEEKEVIEEPFLKINSSPKGGFKTLPFILGSGTLETVAILGIMPNMPLYLINEYHMDVTTSSSILFYWGAVVNFIPVIGAVIADSYVGRLNMMGFGSVVCVLGLALLWSTTVIPGARPPECDVIEDQYCSPSPATAPQLFLLCMSFIVMAVGAGSFKACAAAFGVDQMESDKLVMERYFSWYMSAFEIGILIAYTFIVYIQDKLGWGLGFGVCVVVMVFSVISLFLGIPFYVNVKTKGNLIVELAQVIVAYCNKRHVRLSSYHEYEDMVFYHNNKGSSLTYPTQNLRFLNKACLIENVEQELTEEGRTARNPWRLCTVEQVENLKSLLKVIPIWSTGVLIFATMNHGSFSILQAKSMNRKIMITSNYYFEIPAGSLSTISILSVIIWVIFYRQVILPLASRNKKKPTRFTTKQRMGAGILVCIICVAVSAVVEGIRRRRSTMSMSVVWLVPQHVLFGIVEGLNGFAQFESYISELPRSMSSIASCILLVAGSMGNLLASFLMSSVNFLSSKIGSNESWISTDINKGHYDYYFWCLSGLTALNFFYFLLCCRIYGPCRDEKEDGDDDDEENVQP